MKSVFVIAALAAAATFASEDSARVSLPRLPDSGRTEFVRQFDSLRVLDSARVRETFEAERAKDSAEWAARIPDSIKVKIEARRAAWAAKADSLKGLDREAVKGKIDSLKAAWEAKRSEEVAKLPADVQEKVKARLADVEAKHAAIQAKIEARRAEIAAKIAAKKAEETATETTTTP